MQCELCSTQLEYNYRLCVSCAKVISQLVEINLWLHNRNRDRKLNTEQARLFLLFARKPQTCAQPIQEPLQRAAEGDGSTADSNRSTQHNM